MKKEKQKLNSNKRRILFLVFSPLFTKGGHSKNFINLIKHIEPELKKYKYNASIISYNNNNYEKNENINLISGISFFSSYNVKILKRIFPSGKPLFQFAEYLSNLVRTFLFLLLKRPDIVYAYSNKPLYIISPFKKVFNYKLIYDMRGDVINEKIVQGSSEKYISRLLKTHNNAVNNTDLVFTVSVTYDRDIKSKSVYKFNYYDGDIFCYDESKMLKKKEELKLKDKFVFVYTGSAHYYQFLDGTLNFFSQFLIKHPDSFLIIISEYNNNIFEEMLKNNKIPESTFMINNLPQDEISDLQQVADMGFLLREDLPLNHHSYPTKFAEYLASGVPVLMTPHIHSIAPVVINYKLGEVINIKEYYTDEIENIYSNYKNNLLRKTKCSEFAKKELMWQSKAKDIFSSIRNL